MNKYFYAWTKDIQRNSVVKVEQNHRGKDLATFNYCYLLSYYMLVLSGSLRSCLSFCYYCYFPEFDETNWNPELLMYAKDLEKGSGLNRGSPNALGKPKNIPFGLNYCYSTNLPN